MTDIVPMTIVDYLARAGRFYSDRPAIFRGKELVATYGQLADNVVRVATGLRKLHGLQPGDRVAVFMKNVPEYVLVLHAIWRAGLVAVPLNAKLHAEEAAFIIASSGARLCFVTHDLATSICSSESLQCATTDIVEVGSRDWQRLILHDQEELPTGVPDDIAWLFYTSGTTGRPKGAMLTHANLMSMTTSFFQSVDAPRTDNRLLHCAPMSHGSGLYMIPYICAGASNVVTESGAFDAGELASLLAVHQGVSLFAAPTMVYRMLRNSAFIDADKSNLRSLIYGGGPMFVRDCLEAVELLGDKLIQIYGLGETPMTGTVLSSFDHTNIYHPDYLDRLASIGTPQAGVKLRIIDEGGSTVGAGIAGEIALRSGAVMKGYYEGLSETRETLTDGWLLTGDIGSTCASGYVTLCGRNKDMIVSGGTNIYPKEVEDVLLSHPKVAEVAVVGSPDDEWGERAIAFIVPAQPDLEPAELDEFCRSKMAGFKRPKDYRLLSELPKNHYGKVLKTELRTLAAA